MILKNAPNAPKMPILGKSLIISNFNLWPVTLTFCMNTTYVNGNCSCKFHDHTMTGTWWKRCDGQIFRHTDKAPWSQLNTFPGHDVIIYTLPLNTVVMSCTGTHDVTANTLLVSSVTTIQLKASRSSGVSSLVSITRDFPKSRMNHYGDFIMSTLATQITSLTIVWSNVYSDAD